METTSSAPSFILKEVGHRLQLLRPLQPLPHVVAEHSFIYVDDTSSPSVVVRVGQTPSNASLVYEGELAAANLIPPETGHPGIIDFGTIEKHSWLAMPYVKGISAGHLAFRGEGAREGLTYVSRLFARLLRPLSAVHTSKLPDPGGKWAQGNAGMLEDVSPGVFEKKIRYLYSIGELSVQECALLMGRHEYLLGLSGLAASIQPDGVFMPSRVLGATRLHYDPITYNFLVSSRNASLLDFEQARHGPADIDYYHLFRGIMWAFPEAAGHSTIQSALREQGITYQGYARFSLYSLARMVHMYSRDVKNPALAPQYRADLPQIRKTIMDEMNFRGILEASKQ